MRKSPETCIYCNSKAKMTSEHIFGDWLKKHLNSRSIGTTHFTSFRLRDLLTGETVNSSMAKGRLNRPGAPHAHQLKLVCRKCNETWMNGIQNAARPYLLDLIKGIWPAFTPQGIQDVATWATMVTTSIEFADAKTNTSDESERSLFMTQGHPGQNWRVCVGLCNTASDPGSFWHRASSIGLEESPEIIAQENKVQTTIFPLGRCFFHTLRGPANAIPDAADYAAELGIRQFWPLPNGSLPAPNVFTDAGLNRVATLFWVKNGITPAAHFGMFSPEGETS